jgi:lysophospholipid acyltransferase (LPLAT)-like uncharacterized protein
MSGPIDPVTSRNPQQSKASQNGVSGRQGPANASGAGTPPDLEALRNRVYRFSDLSNYRTRDKLVIRAADALFYSMIGAICSTLRWEVQGSENLDSVFSRGCQPIFTSWHLCMLSATWFWRDRGIVVMSSVSRDAEYTGRVIKRFGYGTVRGSATRGGGRALAEMAKCLENGLPVGFTIDGPRGPAQVAKPGAVTLARHTGQAILPFHIAVSSYIEFPSWDRMQIPLPFARAATFIGKPIYVPRDATSEEVSAKHAAVQSALDSLILETEGWRQKI